MQRNSTRYVVFGGLIAALYVVMTLISQAFGLASGVIQVRLSESLCMLPCATTSAIPGLTIGCLISNFILGCPWEDVVFGTLATLIGAVGTWMMRKKAVWSWIPPVISNAVIVPLVLIYAYHVPDACWFLVLTVGAGELIACGLIGPYVYELSQKANAIALKR